MSNNFTNDDNLFFKRYLNFTCVMWTKSKRADREVCSIISGGMGLMGGTIRRSPVAGNLIAVAIKLHKQKN